MNFWQIFRTYVVFNLIGNDFFCFIYQCVFDLILMFSNFIFYKIKNWILPFFKLNLWGLFSLLIIKKEFKKVFNLVHYSLFDFLFVLIKLILDEFNYSVLPILKSRLTKFKFGSINFRCERNFRNLAIINHLIMLFLVSDYFSNFLNYFNGLISTGNNIIYNFMDDLLANVTSDCISDGTTNWTPI